MSRLFGTDGVRGIVNEDLTVELAVRVGSAAGKWAKAHGLPPRVFIGRDTRKSGTVLSAAVGAGLASYGAEVINVGIAPTAALSYAARTANAALGCVVSASHNPAEYNGIKFFGPKGEKLDEALERLIESFSSEEFEDRPSSFEIGSIQHDSSILEAYEGFLKKIVPEGLAGLKVTVDAAHGAAYEIAPRVLKALGATVSTIGAEPNGVNINAEGGATKPHVVQRRTKELGFDVGVSFDGDADRAVFSDSSGRLINGDRMMAIWITAQQMSGGCPSGAAIGTIMSNKGFEAYLHKIGFTLERVGVGDKNVSRRIIETGAVIGGEQSGHIIFPNIGPTGDGLVTMLEFLKVLAQSKRSAKDWFGLYEAQPQVLVNIKVDLSPAWNEVLKDKIAEAERLVGATGQVSVRASGTQPVLRVMVDSPSQVMRDRALALIVDTVEEKLGGRVDLRVELTHALGD